MASLGRLRTKMPLLEQAAVAAAAAAHHSTKWKKMPSLSLRQGGEDPDYSLVVPAAGSNAAAPCHHYVPVSNYCE